MWEVLGDLQGPKFRVAELAGDPVPLIEGDIVEFALCVNDNDHIRPGRITMKPTLEQRALLKACKPGVDLLIEDGLMKVIFVSAHWGISGIVARSGRARCLSSFSGP